MKNDTTVRDIHINSEIKNIAIIEKLIEEICGDVIGGNEMFGNILIAVLEGVTNCIIHGNKRNPSKQVHIKITYSEAEILFQISDEGYGFDLNAIPDPTRVENIENPHGRGIFLMKRLADEFIYSKEQKTFSLKFYPEKYKELV
jgi:serine/threonine-protein kinase RsbW